MEISATRLFYIKSVINQNFIPFSPTSMIYQLKNIAEFTNFLVKFLFYLGSIILEF